ncbi:MAG TPA: DDE-type integrase/transposase/recombinase [Actinophytocola sp.]|nr:DDE-type integrase/transposase/recombinase [Actinophytocola sp.]
MRRRHPFLLRSYRGRRRNRIWISFVRTSATTRRTGSINSGLTPRRVRSPCSQGAALCTWQSRAAVAPTVRPRRRRCRRRGERFRRTAATPTVGLAIPPVCVRTPSWRPSRGGRGHRRRPPPATPRQPGGVDDLADPVRPRIRHPAAAQTTRVQLPPLPGGAAQRALQLDITHYRLADHTDVEILNIIDDHSRLCVASAARRVFTAGDVNAVSEDAAGQYGDPAGLLSDNGAVFTGAPRRGGRVALELTCHARGIRFTHSRPYHPQTCGKVERFTKP